MPVTDRLSRHRRTVTERSTCVWVASPIPKAWPSSPSRTPPAGTVVREIKDHPFGDPEFSGRSWPLADVRLLAPILPSKVVGIGRNYADHAAETGQCRSG